MCPFIINAATFAASVNCLQVLQYMVIIISYNIPLKIELSGQNMSIKKNSWVIADTFFQKWTCFHSCQYNLLKIHIFNGTF